MFGFYPKVSTFVPTNKQTKLMNRTNLPTGLLVATASKVGKFFYPTNKPTE